MTIPRTTAPVPYYADDLVKLHLGDCIEVMRTLPDNSVHAVVTDPPYGLGFMGKAWDDLPPGLDFALEAFRVLKPGGHILAFGGSRTWHRLAVAVEDAGFEIRDSIAWLYGSGFPKSLDVSKAIDKAAGAEREVVGINSRAAQQTAKVDATSLGKFAGTSPDLTAPATDAARAWTGWGTALKPAFEPIVVGRKPLVGTVAANVMSHGTGALNIDGCRIATSESTRRPNGAVSYYEGRGNGATSEGGGDSGRWPTNVLLDTSQAESLDAQTGILSSGAWDGKRNGQKTTGILGEFESRDETPRSGDSGGASRFFPTFHYEAKAPGNERPSVDGVQHPTVKPLELMRWLVRLVTPPGGIVLEPFAGSGTTLEACLIEGFEVIGIEREADYLPLIMQRITKPLQVSLFGEAIA